MYRKEAILKQKAGLRTVITLHCSKTHDVVLLDMFSHFYLC